MLNITFIVDYIFLPSIFLHTVSSFTSNMENQGIKKRKRKHICSSFLMVYHTIYFIFCCGRWMDFIIYLKPSILLVHFSFVLSSSISFWVLSRKSKQLCSSPASFISPLTVIQFFVHLWTAYIILWKTKSPDYFHGQ